MNAFTWLSCVIGQNFLKNVSHTKNLFRCKFKIRDLSVSDLTKWLMQQHTTVRQRKALAFCSSSQQHRSCRCSLT